MSFDCLRQTGGIMSERQVITEFSGMQRDGLRLFRGKAATTFGPALIELS